MTNDGSGISIQTDEIRDSGSSLHDFSDSISQHGSSLQNTLSRVHSNAGRDRSGIGSAIASAMSGAGDAADDVVHQITRVVSRSGDNLHDTATSHEHNEADTKKSFDDIHPDATSDKLPTTPKEAPHTTEKPGWTYPGNMTDEEYAKFSSKWKDFMKNDTDKTWFWSGGYKTDGTFSKHQNDPGKNDFVDPETGKYVTPGKYDGSLESAAEKMAKENGGNTLEGLLKDNKIQMPGFNDNHPRAGKMWDDASAAVAFNAKGEVHLVLPNTPGKSSGWANHGDKLAASRGDNVFAMKEFPILRHNPDVTRIVAHDIDHGTSNVMWTKGDSAPVPPSQGRLPWPSNVPPGQAWQDELKNQWG